MARALVLHGVMDPDCFESLHYHIERTTSLPRLLVGFQYVPIDQGDELIALKASPTLNTPPPSTSCQSVERERVWRVRCPKWSCINIICCPWSSLTLFHAMCCCSRPFNAVNIAVVFSVRFGPKPASPNGRIWQNYAPGGFCCANFASAQSVQRHRGSCHHILANTDVCGVYSSFWSEHTLDGRNPFRTTQEAVE